MSLQRPADATVVTPAVLRDWPLPMPGREADKNARGSVLVVAGTVRTPGAALLAGIAALRAGAGRLSVATSAGSAPGLGVALPEALVAGLPETPDGNVSGDAAPVLAGTLLERATAVLIGPGFEDPDATTELLRRLLPEVGEDTVVVLDAMALGCLGKRPELTEGLHAPLILTPNQAEGRILLGTDDAVAPREATPRIAEKYGAVVALHGVVAAPDGRAWVDETGHQGLGTSGSGDVLAGLVVGLAARGAEPAQAACWGSHLHGAAGDRLAARIGRLGFLARELLDEAPLVLTELQS
jgi:ADP-dependent NAD(P)H-hydrate dehydratase